MAFRRPLMKNSHTRDAMTAFRRCLMKNSHTLMFASVAQLISPSGLQRVKVAAAGRRCNAGHTGYNLRPPEGSCVAGCNGGLQSFYKSPRGYSQQGVSINSLKDITLT